MLALKAALEYIWDDEITNQVYNKWMVEIPEGLQDVLDAKGAVGKILLFILIKCPITDNLCNRTPSLVKRSKHVVGLFMQ
jgi:hypothetical protein